MEWKRRDDLNSWILKGRRRCAYMGEEENENVFVEEETRFCLVLSPFKFFFFLTWAAGLLLLGAGLTPSDLSTAGRTLTSAGLSSSDLEPAGRSLRGAGRLYQ